MNGFVVVPRIFALDERLKTGEPFDRSRAFLDLVIHATHKDRTLKLRHIETHLEAGEMAASLRTLCRRWHRSLGYVRKTLKALARCGMIIHKPQEHITIIKIVEWERYQGYFYLAQSHTGTEKAPKRDTKMEQYTQEAVSRENELKTQETDPPDDASNYRRDTVSDTPEAQNRDNIQKCILNNKKNASAEASALAAFLLSEILKNNPYMMPPKKADWACDFARLITEAHVPPGVLRQMIAFSQGNPQWNKIVVSPFKLKVHFHKIFLDMKEEERKNNKPVPKSKRFLI